MPPCPQRQDSTTDQIESVADRLEVEGFTSLVGWLRSGGSMPPNAHEASRVAVAIGCYDADDWIKARLAG